MCCIILPQLHHLCAFSEALDADAFDSGNDDEDNEDCQIQTVPNVLAGNPLDHLGMSFSRQPVMRDLIKMCFDGRSV